VTLPTWLNFVVEAIPAQINAIVQRHRALQKVFDHQWAHLVVLDFCSSEFCLYEPTGQMNLLGYRPLGNCNL